MNKYFLIGTICGAFICFAAFIYFSVTNYRYRNKSEYHLRSYFPYELNYDFSFKENIVGNAFLILSVLFFASSFVVPLFNRLNGFYIAIFVVGILSSLLPIALVFTSLNAGKIHIYLLCASFFIALCNDGLLAIQCHQIYASIHYEMGLIGMILAIFLAIFLLVLILNPKLKNWGKLEQQKNEDGTISYVRPRYFVLAFSEWLLMIAHYLSLIPLFLLIFSLK